MKSNITLKLKLPVFTSLFVTIFSIHKSSFRQELPVSWALSWEILIFRFPEIAGNSSKKLFVHSDLGSI